ncbi:MAG: protein kinase, partial [Gemmatimonadales bacterium]
MAEQFEKLKAALAGRYRIERELGQGGMATVYLAQDLKHQRKVAIKVLRPELAAVLGAERFVQEITTTASLQHPHILPLFDSGEAGGFLYYVMPYVQGETIREKLNRETQFGIEEAVKITTEVADALDYAHRSGVIHRDIKPENILLHDGRPMVMDFGIALAVSAAAGGRMTETGMSLGTPHYMSPEQATADKDVTSRSDIYSLGSVLYEMLTGQPPHLGASAQQIIMQIVTETPKPVTQLRKSVPPNVAAAVSRSLEKLPADRFESAARFAEALTDPAFTIMTAAGARDGAPTVNGWKRLATAAAAAAVLFLLTTVWGWLRPAPHGAVTRYALAFPGADPPFPFSGVPLEAPDGSFLVYVGQNPDRTMALWLKRRDRAEPERIPGGEGVTFFDLSPDGEWIIATGSNGLTRLPTIGGAAVTLAPAATTSTLDPVWLDDGSIVYHSGSLGGWARIPSDGGEPALVFADERLSSTVTGALPAARGVLVSRCGLPTTATATSNDACALRAIDLRDGTEHDLVPGRWAQYAETGHLVYLVDDRLYAVRFDPDAMRVLGAPVLLVDGVGPGTGSRDFRLSRSGTMVMRSGGGRARALFTAIWVDRTGRATLLDSSFVFDPRVAFGGMSWALSPDDSRLAISRHTESGDDIWVKTLPRGPLSRVTFDPTPEYRPRWTPDGRALTFIADGRDVAGLYQRPADGTGMDSLLYPGSLAEGVWHPGREWLLLRTGTQVPGRGGRDIIGYRPGVDTSAVPVIVTPFDENAIMPSPDGRWLAYQSDETGRYEVFIRPFPDTDAGKWQVSQSGGRGPLWSKDGRELFWLSDDNVMMGRRVTAGPTLQLGEPDELFRLPREVLIGPLNLYTPWDVAADGRFLMVRPVSEERADPGAIIVVESFFEEL